MFLLLFVEYAALKAYVLKILPVVFYLTLHAKESVMNINIREREEVSEK